MNKEKKILINEYNKLYTEIEELYKGSYPIEIMGLLFIAKVLVILAKDN